MKNKMFSRQLMVIYKLSLLLAWFNVDLTLLATRRRLSKVQSFKLIYDCSHECVPNRFGSQEYLVSLKVDNYRFLDLSFVVLRRVSRNVSGTVKPGIRCSYSLELRLDWI